MNRLLIAIGLSFLLLAPSAARPDDPPAPASCGVSTQPLFGADQNSVTIACSGISEAFANQLAGLMTRILHDRLDPQLVNAKLDEVEPVPEDGVARSLDEGQRHAIVQSLAGKDGEQIMITAHPAVEDSAAYAKELATPLLMVGWQIEGHQIRRAVSKTLEPVQGVAVVVRDKSTPPQKAQRLKAALGAGRVHAPFVSDPSLAPEATVLWIGKRPALVQADAPKQ